MEAHALGNRITIATAAQVRPPAQTPAAAPPEQDQRGGGNVALITLTVMLGLIMAIIDLSIVNVALNTMAGNLGASIDEISWVATGYILAQVVIMPLNGYLTALFGRKRFYAGCVAIFTITSFLCGTATSVGQLVVYRVLQGIGGGALQPTAQAILFESYPPEKRGNAMAFFGLGAMVGPAIGPTLGGWIVDNYSWPLIFFINVPIGVVAFIMTLMFIRDPSYIRKPERGADWIGLGAMALGIASVQYVLERGQREDWFSSPAIVVLSIVGIIALAFFVVRELRDPQPFVDLRVFKNRSFTAGCVVGVIAGFGLFGLNLTLPLFFQNVLGFDAWQTGLALLPGAIATAVSMPLAARAGRYVQPRISVIAGLTLFAIGSWMMGSLDQDAGYWDVFWPRAVQGFALGFLFVPLSTSALAEISRSMMANATGIFTLVRQLGGSLGIAVLELLEIRREDAAQQDLASGITLSNPEVAQVLHGAADRAHELQQLTATVVQNATVIAYDYTFQLTAILFLLSIPTTLLMRGGPSAEQEHALTE